MNIFPNTSVYLVSYRPGTCGRFITDLVLMFLGIESDKKRELTEHGSAHLNHSYAFNRKRLVDISTINFMTDSSFLLYDPIDENKMMMLHDHAECDYELLFKKYPKAKVITIQFEDDDRTLIGVNCFYKVTIDSFNLWSPVAAKWASIKDLYFNGIENPNDVPVKMVFDFIEKTYPAKVPKPWLYGSAINTDHRITYWRFKDILFDKDKTLNMLSQYTGSPITTQIITYYDEYLEKQKKLWKLIEDYHTCLSDSSIAVDGNIQN